MKKGAAGLIAAYLAIWGISIFIFFHMWCSDDGIGFSLIFLYILIPLATVALSLIVGLKGIFGKGIAVWIIAMGVMYMMSEYCSFAVANNLMFDKVNPPEYGMIPAGMALSAIGYAIGFCIKKKRTG